MSERPADESDDDLRVQSTAHELNNLLTIINSYTELMLEQEQDPESARRFLTEVLAAGRRAAELTAELRPGSQAPESGPGEVDRPSVGTETILLAEDEGALRRLIERVLTGAGYNVVTASDGAQALSLLDSMHADLLVTDVVMPKMGGPKLVQTLVERRPNMKVLYISGYGANDVAQHGVTDTINLLKKPFSGRELLVEVRKMLDGSAPRSH